MNLPKIVSTFELVMKKGGVNENSVQSQAIWGSQFEANLHIYSLNWSGNADIESCNRAYWLFAEAFNVYNTCTILFLTCQCTLPPPAISIYNEGEEISMIKGEKTKKGLEDIHITPRWSNSSGYPFILAWQGIQIYALFCFFFSHKNWAKCRAQFFHQFYSRVVRNQSETTTKTKKERKNGGSQKSMKCKC